MTEFVPGQVPLSLDLLIALDPLRRVVSAVAPLDRQREHLRQEQDGPVGPVGGMLGHLPVKGVDVAVGDVSHFVVPELRRFGPCSFDGPARERADRVAALSAGFGPVVEDNGASARSGDTTAEALYRGVVLNAVAGSRGGEVLDDLVGEMPSHCQSDLVSAIGPSQGRRFVSTSVSRMTDGI